MSSFSSDSEGDHPPVIRRAFLRHASLLPFGAAAGLGTSAAPDAGKLKPAPRVGGSQLKVSVNAFSRFLNAKINHGKEGIDLLDLVDFSAKNDIDGFDPTAFVQELKQAIAETA